MFLQFYGLREQPFSVTPDPRFLYMGPAHQEALASLVYGIEMGRGFMALIAAPGMGKTTLTMRLMEQLRDSALTAFLFQTHASSKEFLKNLLLDLDVEPTGQDLSDLQAQLREVLIQAARSGKRLVVVIDEAQTLDDGVLEMVRMLSNFEAPQAKFLQIILVGQPGLADKLAQPHLAQLRQRISIITHFAPLCSTDVEKYIDHRLRVAGYKGENLFTSEALGLIARHSGGTPRIINNLCFNALSLGYAKQQKRIDVASLREVIADLNLEALAERARAGAPAATQAASAAPPNNGTGAMRNEPRLEISKPRILREPAAAAPNLLDRVDVADYASERSRKTAVRPRRNVDVLLFVAIAAVAVWIWQAPWLKPSLQVLGQSGSAVLSKILGPQLSTGNRPTPTLPGPDLPLPEPSSGAALAAPVGAASGARPTNVLPGEGRSVAQSQVPARPAAKPVGRREAPKKAGTVVPAFSAARVAPPVSAVKPVSAPSWGRSDSLDDLGAPGPRGELIVQSSVAGAHIRLNGRSNARWLTPHRFFLAAGTYTVSIWKNGYVNWTRSVRVDRGKDNWILAELSNDDTGILTVQTDPAGMQVYIDGRPYGASRVVTVLGAGWHTCKVVPPSGINPVVGRFHLDPGEALTKTIRVRTVAAPAGSELPASNGAMAGRGTIPRGEHLE